MGKNEEIMRSSRERAWNFVLFGHFMVRFWVFQTLDRSKFWCFCLPLSFLNYPDSGVPNDLAHIHLKSFINRYIYTYSKYYIKYRNGGQRLFPIGFWFHVAATLCQNEKINQKRTLYPSYDEQVHMQGFDVTLKASIHPTRNGDTAIPHKVIQQAKRGLSI